MEQLSEKEALIIQACILFVIDAQKVGQAKFNNGCTIQDLENLLKKLRGERCK